MISRVWFLAALVLCVPAALDVADVPQTSARPNVLLICVDIYPTLCELAGVPVPTGLDGRSFAAALRDVTSTTRDHAIHVFPRNAPGKGPVLGRAIRTERYRLVEWKMIGAPAEDADLELYDYYADPLETQNLAGAQPDIVAQLRVLLAQHPEATPQISVTQ